MSDGIIEIAQPSDASAAITDAAQDPQLSPSQDRFDANLTASDLRQKSVRGGKFILLSQAATFALNLATTVVLARLLVPEHYGLVGMVAAVFGFVGILRDAGISTAIVQHPSINHEQISTVFWLNVALGLVLTLAVALSAPLFMRFYHEPRLQTLVWALAPTFLLDSFVTQHLALLQRRMEFGWTAAAGLISQAGGAVVGGVLAWAGFGVWALVATQMAPKILLVPLVWFFAAWVPGLPVRRSGVRPMLRFASGIAGFNAVNYVARNFDNVLIGQYLGAITLGIYSRAYLLFMLPFQQLTYPLGYVAIPAMARLKDDRGRFREYYVKMLYLLALVALPLTLVLFALGDHVVRVVLGPGWHDAGWMLQLLAAALPIQILMSTAGWVFVAVGRSKAFLIVGIINSICVAAAFMIGLIWGVKGLIIGYLIVTWVVGPFWLIEAYRGTDIRVRDVLMTWCRVLPHSIIAALVALGIMRYLPVPNEFGRFALAGTMGTLVYGAGLWLSGDIARVRKLLAPGEILPAKPGLS